MNYSDDELYDVVVELDAFAEGLSEKSIDFIADILDKDRKKFTSKQRQWIMDLKEHHLI